jgi:Flp pilus assembly protein TadG
MTANRNAIRPARRRRAAILWRCLRHTRGNAAIEVALTLPAVLLMMFGVIEFGRALWLQSALDFSVVEAARCASVNPTRFGTADEIKAFASTQAGSGFDSSVFSTVTASCGNQVSGSYPMTLTIPFAPISVTLTAQACFPS